MKFLFAVVLAALVIGCSSKPKTTHYVKCNSTHSGDIYGFFSVEGQIIITEGSCNFDESKYE